MHSRAQLFWELVSPQLTWCNTMPTLYTTVTILKKHSCLQKQWEKSASYVIMYSAVSISNYTDWAKCKFSSLLRQSSVIDYRCFPDWWLDGVLKLWGWKTESTMPSGSAQAVSSLLSWKAGVYNEVGVTRTPAPVADPNWRVQLVSLAEEVMTVVAQVVVVKKWQQQCGKWLQAKQPFATVEVLQAAGQVAIGLCQHSPYPPACCWQLPSPAGPWNCRVHGRPFSLLAMPPKFPSL